MIVAFGTILNKYSAPWTRPRRSTYILRFTILLCRTVEKMRSALLMLSLILVSLFSLVYSSSPQTVISAYGTISGSNQVVFFPPEGLGLSSLFLSVSVLGRAVTIGIG